LPILIYEIQWGRDMNFLSKGHKIKEKIILMT